MSLMYSTPLSVEWFDSFLFQPTMLKKKTFHKCTPMPLMDIIDNGDSYTVKMDVPGYKSEDIDVVCNDGLLTVTCNKSSDFDSEHMYYCERKRMISRTLHLPKDVDTFTEFDAELADGVLSVKMLKHKALPEQKVHIKVKSR